MTTNKTNGDIAIQWQEIIDSKSFQDLSLVESSSIININPSGTFPGMDAHLKMLQAFAVAFPNYLHTNFRYIEQDEWVCFEGEFTGDHTGPVTLDGKLIPPTGNHIEFPYAGFLKIKDGKVTENRLYYDSKIFTEQLNGKS